MKRIKFLIIALLATAPRVELEAQTYLFKNFDINEGLPSNTVTCSMQDRRGFMWFGTKDGICRYDGTHFRVFGDEESEIAMSGMAQALCEDSTGMIWFTTIHGTGYYDPDTDIIHVMDNSYSRTAKIICDRNGDVWFFNGPQLRRYCQGRDSEIINGFDIKQACTDGEGNLWCIDGSGKLLARDYGNDSFIYPPVRFGCIDEKATRICSAGSRSVLVCTDRNRIYLYDGISGRTSGVIREGLQGAIINCLLCREEGEYWIGSRQGLYVFNDRGLRGPLQNVGNYTIQDSNIISMSRDSFGNVWLGTFHSGLSLWYNKIHGIVQFIDSGARNSIKGHFVKAIESDGRGRIWVGTEDGFLNLLQTEQRYTWTLGEHNGLPATMNYHDLLADGNRMWIAAFDKGLYAMDTGSLKVERHYELGGDGCSCLLKTADGRLLAGTRNGLYVFDEAEGTFGEFEGLNGKWIHHMIEDSHGSIWIASYGGGLFRIRGTEITNITKDTPDAGLMTNFLVYLFEDSAHRLWIATEGAGICYTTTDGSLRFGNFAKKDGLPSNIACSISQDSGGSLWIATTRGMVKFDPENTRIQGLYLDTNGSTGDNYNYCACFGEYHGNMHFGTTKGLVKIVPNLVADRKTEMPLYIVDIHAGEEGKSINLRSEGKSTIMSDKIRLKSRDASHLSISFAAPIFSDLDDPLYEYTMKDKHSVIHSTTRENEVIFTGLRSGKHHFEVKLAGSGRECPRKELEISVIPPFYNSSVAYILYTLILAAILFQLNSIVKKKKEEEKRLENEKMEAAKQKEIAEAKVSFFTNITHEIRTPLTLIKLPVDKIIRDGGFSDSLKDDMLTIQANTNRLLNLSNQLLDIRKIERKDYIMNLSDFDICKFTRKICGYFAPGIHERHLAYSENIPAEQIVIRSDTDFLEKILCNLLSNALKYSEGTIGVSLTPSPDGNTIRLAVNSSGDLLSGKEAEKIFEPFYQVRTVNSQIIGSNGTGLGLPYARNLARALGGDLFLDSKRKDCNSFVLKIPVTSTAESAIIEAREDKTNAGDSNRHWILVVEDSSEMNEYLCRELSPDYNVLSAENGEEAVEVIRNNKVDLVVSDIMMPVMDGCQLCNFVKKNLEYSHIPVILLTAVVGVETRIETLEVGADGYIEKPFSMELLKANIANLFKNREISYNQFANSPLSHFNGTVVNNIDKEFMDKLHDAVMDNISDQDLDIERLTNIMHTSKSTLYRKVKANTGVNINEYIRICRLKKAAEMLSSQKYRINEVAYLTGFSSPSYFATSFQKQFKVSPSNFVKNLTKAQEK